MTNEELLDLKEQLADVMGDIEEIQDYLNQLQRNANVLKEAIAGYERKPVSTNIEYLFSKFDYELSEYWCAKTTVTKAKKLLLNCGYTDLKQLEGRKIEDFLELCDGTKVLGVVLAYCYKCNVNMNLESQDIRKNSRIRSIKCDARRFMMYIVF